jgi:hypothetical protein
VDALHQEWQFRHGHTKVHKSYLMAQYIREYIREHVLDFPVQGQTPFALAMPDEYKTDDPVESYRLYYKKDKAHIATWKKRAPPEWFYAFK